MTTDITTRIADILKARVKFACTCGCGVRADCTYGHASYVAGVLVSELGLTREGPSCREYTGLHRYVTEWVADA